MARQPRYVLPGQPQHVIQRGVDRGATFFDDEDYLFYLECLRDACRRCECAVHAYVLMTNHIHLLLTPARENSIGNLMQCVGRRYVRYVNHTYRRTGTLWEGRYRATLVDSEGYLLTCMRYIELNPVRAGMVDHPGAYRWSSYRANGNGVEDLLIVRHEVYLRLGDEAAERRRAYRELFRAHLDEPTLRSIRAATQNGWVLGRERFSAEVAAMLNRRALPLPRGGDRRSAEYRKARTDRV